MSRFIRPAVAAFAAACAGTAALATGAQAGPFLSSQPLTEPVLEADYDSLAVGPRGTAAFAFGQTTTVDPADNTTNRRVFVAVRDQGAPTALLGAAEPVSDAGVEVADTQLGIDAAGNTTLMLWVSSGDQAATGEAQIFVRTRPSGGSWGPAQSIATQDNVETARQTTSPELVVAADGRALLLTEEGLFDRAAGATSFVAVPGTADVRHIAVNASGQAAALVYGAAATSPDGYAYFPASVRTSSESGTFGPPTAIGEVDYDSLQDQNRSAIAISDTGSVVATWEGAYFVDHPETVGVNVAVRTPGADFGTGTWSTTYSANTNFYEGPGSFGLTAAAETPSQVVVSWAEINDPTYVIPGGTSYEQRFPGTEPRAAVTTRESSIRKGVSAGANGRAVSLAFPFPAKPLLRAQVRPSVGAAFGPVQTVLSAPQGSNEVYNGLGVALDDQGNGYISWQGRSAPSGEQTGSRSRIGVVPYDPVPPVITSVKATTAQAGKPLALTAVATDRMSTPTITWAFGDGRTTGRGKAVLHTYAKPGPYVVKVSARDQAGNTTTTSKLVLVTK